MKSALLEKLFVILDDAREAGRLSEADLSDTMVVLAQDVPRVEKQVLDHVVLLNVSGELTNVYGPLSGPDADTFVCEAVTRWQLAPGSLFTTRRLETPVVGSCGVSPSTPLDSGVLEGMG